MTLTIESLLVAEPALARLLKKELPLKLAYHVAKLYRLVATEARTFEETRAALVRRLGDPNGDGSVTVKPENRERYAAEIRDVMQADVLIDWTPLSMRAFGSLPTGTLTGQDIYELGVLLTENDDGPT